MHWSPTVGAVFQTDALIDLGHVAYVKAVNSGGNGEWTITEMNVKVEYCVQNERLVLRLPNTITLSITSRGRRDEYLQYQTGYGHDPASFLVIVLIVVWRSGYSIGDFKAPD